MSLEHAMLSLTGLSVGDAFGQALFFPESEEFMERRELPPPPWKWTDETQMALSVFETLSNRGSIDQDYLARRLAWRFALDPARGFRRTTVQIFERVAQGEYFRSVINDIMGKSFEHSDYVAARSALVGAYYSETPEKAFQYALLETKTTNLHPEALIGAQAISVAAALAASNNHPQGIDFLNAIIEFLPESKVKTGIILASEIPPDDIEQARQTFGSKYYSLSNAQASVPFSLWCAAHHLDNYQEALWFTVSGLGRRESTCAIVGSIVALSSSSVPHTWIERRETLPREVEVVLIENEYLGNYENKLPVQVFKAVGSNKGGVIPSLTIRQNSLTGLSNLIGFVEMLDNSFLLEKLISHNYVTIQLGSFSDIEKEQGRTGKENILKILAGNLQISSPGRIFQLSDELFIIFLNEIDGLEKIFKEISNCVSKSGIINARIKIVQFPKKQLISSNQILSCLQTVLSDSTDSSGNDAHVLIGIEEFENVKSQNNILNDLARQLQQTSQQYDDIEKIAFTDSVSQLPNMRAGRIKLESQIQKANETVDDFAIILFDGDNLRRYNAVSFEDGDEAIRLLGKTLGDNIRENDYVARWRTGDEFLVILPKTTMEEAKIIGNNLCLSVQNASKEWKFPSTISGGCVIYPKDGEVIHDLLELVEKRMKNAKRRGKNRIVFGRKKLKSIPENN